MATQGASLGVIGKSLGHRSLASTEKYARLSTQPVREALDKYHHYDGLGEWPLSSGKVQALDFGKPWMDS